MTGATTEPVIDTTIVDPVTTSTSPSTTVEAPPTHPELTDFPVVGAAIAGESLWLAMADDVDLRRRGLMNVTTLDPLDGMVFVFEDDTTSGFWMKDTLIPLDIAFFDADGGLVAVRTMVPCETESCPVYSPGAPYRFAVEVPAGTFADLPEDARLEI